MAAVIGKVSAIFSASTSGLTSGCNRASAALNRVSQDVRGVRGSMALLTAIQGAQLFGQIAGSVSNAVRSFTQMGAAQGEVIDKTSKLAARLGFTYGELAGLSLAGELAGVSLDTIANAATKADLAFVRAAGGSKTAIAAFQKIGLSVEQLNGMTASERFDAIAASIAALPTEAERAAAAVAIFGKSGAQLLPLFADGAQGIAQARAEAQRFGLTLSNVQGRNVEAMNDAFTRAAQAIKGIVGQVVAYLAPAINSVVTKFSDFVGEAGGANIGQAIGAALLNGALALAQVADYIVENVGGVFDNFAAAFSGLSAIVDATTRAGMLLSAVFSVGTLVFSGIANILLSTVSTVTGMVADLASLIPGMGSIADSIRSAADATNAASNGFSGMADSAVKNIVDSMAVVAGKQKDTNMPAGEGAATKLVRDAQLAAQMAAIQQDAAAKTTLAMKPAVATDMGVSANALKATDATSKEGIAEMFRLMRGEGMGDVQERQLEVQQRIADGIEQLVGDGADYTEAALPAY